MSETALDELLLIVNDKQELHPDLQKYVVDTSHFRMIQHPLMHTLYMGGTESMLNKGYEQKQKMLAEYEAKGAWGLICTTVFDKPHRLDALLRYGYKMTDAEYWSTVADIWTGMEYFYGNMDKWAQVFDVKRGDKQFLMDEDEREKFANLPDELVLYRGGSPDGWSWTLDRDVAGWFARRFGQGLRVHKHVVEKCNVDALFNGRGEKEILWRHASTTGGAPE
jgi:hypothetical protein